MLSSFKVVFKLNTSMYDSHMTIKSGNVEDKKYAKKS